MPHPRPKGASKARGEGGAARAERRREDSCYRGRTVSKGEALERHQVHFREGVYAGKVHASAKDPPEGVQREERSGEQEVVMCVVAS